MSNEQADEEGEPELRDTTGPELVEEIVTEEGPVAPRTCARSSTGLPSCARATAY